MTDQSPRAIDASPIEYGERIDVGVGDLVTLASMLGTPLRYVRMIVVTALVTAVSIVLLGIITARFVSESAFAPATPNSNLQGLLGVAAQFGLNVGNLNGGQSVDSYGSLLQSRDLLTEAVTTPYRFPSGSGASDSIVGNLLQIYGVSGKNHADSVLRAIEKLQGRMSVTVDETGNTVTINVKAPWPGLAEAINRRLLDGVNSFNVDQLKSQASEERQFIEARLVVAQTELDSAEDRLRKFLEQNRTYANSPRLQFEEQRLQARVDLRTQLFTTLEQSYEQARIAEVRNTPVITIIDTPEGSAIRHRHIARNGILGLIVGTILGMGLAFGLDYIRRERLQNPGEYAELARLQARALRRLSPRALIERSE